MAKIEIPLGARIEVERENGTIERFVFKGNDDQGWCFEDDAARCHADLGQYRKLIVHPPRQI